MTPRILLATIVVMAIPATTRGLCEAGSALRNQDANNYQCIEPDANGEQHWMGEQGNEVKAMANVISQGLDDYPDEGTGVVNCSHYEGAVVFKTANSPHFALIVSQVERQYANLVVETRIVPNSRATLLEFARDLMRDSPADDLVTGVAPNVYTGGLDLYTAANVAASGVADHVASFTRPRPGKS